MQVSPRVQRTATAAGVGVGTVGVLVAVFMLGALATSVLILVVFALIWPLAAVIRYVADEIPYESSAVVAACAAGAVLCVPGVVRLLTWGAAGLALALIGAVVFVLVDLVLPDEPRERKRRSPQYGGLAAVLDPEEAREDEKLIASLQCPLSIEELCGVWGETAMTLAEGAGPRDRQAVAEVRRICLDEFERRNPDGFHRWIEAGAPANPGLYLLPEPD
jgi:hypothetical protein